MHKNLTKWVMVVGMLGGSLAFGAAPAPTKEMLEKAKTAFGRNCAACHVNAEQGDFDERAVRIPR